MKVLFVQPFDRTEDVPRNIPFELTILAKIADGLGHKIEVFDINAFRETNNYEGIKAEIGGKEWNGWDLFWINTPVTAYEEVRKLSAILRKVSPETVITLGGKLPTYLPEETMKLIPSADVCVVGDQEEAFKDILDKVAGQKWSKILGIAYRENEKVVVTEPRPLRKDLDDIPFPEPRFVPLERYFQFSAMPLTPQTQRSQRRLNFSWERKSLDPETGKWLIRLPTPKRAIENMKQMRYKYAMDLAVLVDEDITSNREWFTAFLNAYIDEGMDELVRWGCIGDATALEPNPVATTNPIRLMKDAGCNFIGFNFDGGYSAEKAKSFQSTLSAIKKNGLTSVLGMSIGYPKETVDDILAMTDFLINNRIEAGIRIIHPLPDTEYFKPHRDDILAYYDQKDALKALDLFLRDDLRDVTAVISDEFTEMELIALKTLVRNKDIGRILRWSHRRWTPSMGKEPHGEKWRGSCPVCKREELIVVLPESGGLMA